MKSELALLDITVLKVILNPLLLAWEANMGVPLLEDLWGAAAPPLPRDGALGAAANRTCS